MLKQMHFERIGDAKSLVLLIEDFNLLGDAKSLVLLIEDFNLLQVVIIELNSKATVHNLKFEF